MKYILLVLFFGFQMVCASEKMYIDDEEIRATDDAYYVHIGNNNWINASCVHRDATGFFIYEFNIEKSFTGYQCSYKKTWKCPYCYKYWPIGVACQNPDCPSKYIIKLSEPLL